jgi:cell division protein FtsW
MEHTEQMNTEQPKRETVRTAKGPMDLPFALLVILLSGIGLVMMFSASYAVADARTPSPAYFVSRQGVYMIMGVVAMFAVSRFNHNYFSSFSVPAMIVSVILLIVVLFVGSDQREAVRWINFGFFNVQPSEIAKVAVIVFFATMIAAGPGRLEHKKPLPALWGIAPYMGVLVLVAGLMSMQPHFSGIVLILAVGGVMLFMGGLALRWIALVGAAGVGGMAILITATDYAARRIAIWQDPWLDVQGGGWQTIQSLYAVASGGWFGLGLGQSRQKYSYLPEPHNDFVFAIVCEELGLFGALMVLFLFMLLIMRGFWIALNARDTFGRLLVAGVTARLAIQTFLNVAVVTNLIPVTGISMPFFSYGGSSLVIQMVEMGIVLAVSRQMRVTNPVEA